MAKNVFSVPIFFIVFRETLEASLIVAILLGLVEQIVSGGLHTSPAQDPALHGHGENRETHEQTTPTGSDEKASGTGSGSEPTVPINANANGTGVLSGSEGLTKKAFVRKMRIQIFAGTAAGLLVSLAIGAAFVAVWFTQANNFWSKSEALWEGVFSLIASIIIFVMGITMLKLDQAKAKWRVKLRHAFDKSQRVEAGAKTGRWVLFLLPFITVLREGLEAVVFVGGVALGQPASAIPIAAIVGILCGLICGYIIYQFASRATMRVFLVVMTNLLLLIGAGLFSKSVGDFEKDRFNRLLGKDVDDAGGDGPGTFPIQQSVWHLDCCNRENKFDNEGWSIFSAIFGWTNSATIGSVVSYVVYWICVILVLVWMKWREGRTRIMGKESETGLKRREKKAAIKNENTPVA